MGALTIEGNAGGQEPTSAAASAWVLRIVVAITCMFVALFLANGLGGRSASAATPPPQPAKPGGLIAGLVGDGGLLDPVLGLVEPPATPPGTPTVRSTVQGVAGVVDPVVAPLQPTVAVVTDPVSRAVVPTANQVLEPVRSVTAPVVGSVTAPVVGAVTPVVTPVVDALAPVVGSLAPVVDGTVTVILPGGGTSLETVSPAGLPTAGSLVTITDQGIIVGSLAGAGMHFVVAPHAARSTLTAVVPGGSAMAATGGALAHLIEGIASSGARSALPIPGSPWLPLPTNVPLVASSFMNGEGSGAGTSWAFLAVVLAAGFVVAQRREGAISGLAAPFAGIARPRPDVAPD
jgi:hypothetical protein